MKFNIEQNMNSRVKTPETNGQITSDNEEQNNENINNKNNQDTENDVEGGNTQASENLKYTFTI